MRYGTHPIAWSNDDDHSIGGDITLETCLNEAASIGFDGIEQGHKMPTDPTELKAVLGAHGLEFIAGWYGLNLLTNSVATEQQALQQRLDFLGAMGTKICIVCETSNAIHSDAAIPLTATPVLDRAQWVSFPAAVEEIAQYCAKQGFTLAYHHHLGTVVETQEEIERFMAATGPHTHLLLDTGHAFGAGADPGVLAAKYLDRVAHIHAKNVRPAIRAQVIVEGLSFLDGVRRGMFTVPGDPEGGVDYAPVLQHAAQAGYAGWLVVEAEQDSAVRNPVEYQSMGLQELRKLAGAAGLE